MLTIEKKSLKVGRFVDNQHVDSLVSTYKKEKWAFNSERLGKADSMSNWYSIEELEEFIEKAKMHGGDGVRIYFGAYPSDFAEKPEYAGRQTVVFVATKSKETETRGLVHKDLYIGTEKGTSILAYNFSSMCPPYSCPGGKSGGGIAEGDDWGGIGTTLVDCGEKGMIIV